MGHPATYTASGALANYQSQNLSGTVVSTLTNSYNKRLQPVTSSAVTPQGTVFSLTYNFNLGNGDNGDVYGITNNLSPSRSTTYAYDAVNRLSTAGTASTWGDSYTYDTWGNLTAKTVTKGTAESFSATVNSNNQLAGWGYDGAGNLIGAPQENTFNAENQWTYQNTYNVSYLYDGDGQRVMASGGASVTRLFWYDAQDRVIEDTEGSNTNEYLYLGNQRISWVYNLSSTHYFYDDNLGTARMIVNSNGMPCYDADFFPWGDEQHVYGNTCPQNYKFNDKERDPDMGVYDFGARFYQDAMARFYQPDWSATPEAVPYAKLNNPQSLNLYAYTVDNPLSLRDPNGHLWNASAVMDSSEEVPGAPGCEGGGVQPCELAEGQQDQNQHAQSAQNQSQSQDQPNQPSSEQPQQQKPPSWDPSKPLPDDPSKLGPDWKRDPDHKAPNDERYVNDKGDKVDWHKGQPGEKGWQGKDHWHWGPGGEKQDDHYRPGDTIKKIGIAAGVGAAVGVAVHVIIETAPEWAPILVF